MNRYLIYCSFIGRNYSGFQAQARIPLINDQRTKKPIQEAIEAVLGKMNKERTILRSSSRTDAEVNAYRMPCTFVLNRANKKDLPLETIKTALNYHLMVNNEEISVVEIKEVPMDFNPRRKILEKEYVYRVEANLGNVFDFIQQRRKLVWSMKEILDLEKVQAASQVFVGTHDFKHFTSTRVLKEEKFSGGTKRIIESVELAHYQPEFQATDNIQAFELRFKGRSFMQYQIRYMVNAIVGVGLGKFNIGDVKELLDRAEQIQSHEIAAVLRDKAPPHALFLKDVKYKE